MPTYDYKCSACGCRFEVFERIHESDVKTCPECGKKKAHRQIGAGAGVIFKGSGFYSTDHRKTGSGPAEPEKKTSPEPEKKKTARKEKKEEKKS